MSTDVSKTQDGPWPGVSHAHILLRQWLNGIKISQVAHKKAAAAYHRNGRLLGLFVTIGTIVVGTSVFTSLTSSASVGLRIFAGCLSVLVAVAAGMQTFLDYSALCSRHRSAATDYGRLRLEVEELLLRACASDLLSALTDIRVRWITLERESPELPQRLHDIAKRQMMSIAPAAPLPSDNTRTAQSPGSR